MKIVESDNERIHDMMADPHITDVFSKATEESSFGNSLIYFKWTCGGCGARAVADDPNSLYTLFKHDECGYTTKTVDGDLGFMLVLGPECLDR